MIDGWGICYETAVKLMSLPVDFTDDKLTHCGRDKMAAISPTTFANVFSWMKMFELR